MLFSTCISILGCLIFSHASSLIFCSSSTSVHCDLGQLATIDKLMRSVLPLPLPGCSSHHPRPVDNQIPETLLAYRLTQCNHTAVSYASRILSRCSTKSTGRNMLLCVHLTTRTNQARFLSIKCLTNLRTATTVTLGSSCPATKKCHILQNATPYTKRTISIAHPAAPLSDHAPV